MTRRSTKKLTDKQKLFAEEYLVDLNATQAYIRAGYSKKGARQAAHKLLTNADIQEAIQAGRERLGERAKKSAIDVVNELTSLGFTNMLDYLQVNEEGEVIGFDLNALSREQAAAIQEITVTAHTTRNIKDDTEQRTTTTRFKLADKKGSLHLLGKHFGLFPTKVEHAGPGGGPIETVQYEPLDLARRILFALKGGDVKKAAQATKQ